MSSLVFFVGILLAVATLEHTHILSDLAKTLDQSIGRLDLIVLVIGMVSAIVDNVPLVAAAMGMYDLQTYCWADVSACATTTSSPEDEKKPRSKPRFCWLSAGRRLHPHVHAAHATHAAHARHAAGSRFVFDQLGDHAVGGEHQAGDGRGVLQCGTGNLGRIEHAHFDHVAVGAVGGVEAEVAGTLDDLFTTTDGSSPALATISRSGCSMARRTILMPASWSWLSPLRVPTRQRGRAAAQRRRRGRCLLQRRHGWRAARLRRGPSFLHFDFGGGTDLDDGHAAGQLGNALLQLFAVVVAGGFLDLHADLLDAGFDGLLVAGTIDEGGVFLADSTRLAWPRSFRVAFSRVRPVFFGDDDAAGQDGDVFQHGLATVAEARGLDGNGLEDAADVVDHQGGQRFAIDVLGDDQQRTTGLGDLLQHRQQVTDVRDLLVEEQDERVVEQGDLLFRVVDEVGRQVAAVELHAFDDVEFVLAATCRLQR